MKKPLIVLIAASVIALAAAAPAAEPEKKMTAPAMQAPKPAAELATLEFFNGRWGCTGHFLGNEMAPAHATSATVMTAPELGGFWRMARYTEKKTTENSMPYALSAVWGYDAAQKRLIEQGVDNIGGYWTFTSNGWTGEVLVFEGESQMMGHKAGGRDTFTKKGANEFVHLGEMQGQDGTWAKVDEETCKKLGTTPEKATTPSR